MSRGTICGLIFFKFWNVSDFLQKHLAWLTKFYLSVQSKNCGKKPFFCSLSRIFSDFERKTFQSFGQKTSRICKNYLLRVQRNNLWLDFFLSFETFRIFCRNIWHGSQNSIHVSRVKIAEKKFFFVFFPEFFQFLSRNFSDFWPKNFKNLSKLPSTCPEEQFVAWNFILSFETFRIFCRNIWHGSQNSIYVSRVKIAEKTVFYCFISRFFSEFWAKYFQTLGQKTSKSFQNYLLRVQRNSLWLEIFI